MSLDDENSSPHKTKIKQLFDVREGLLDPDVPDQELRLHMGELTGDEILVARAAIRRANSRIQPYIKELEHDIDRHINITSEQATEIIKLQARVKELEASNKAYADLVATEIGTVKKNTDLQRKLEVARDLVRDIIDGDLPNVWQHTSEIDPEIMEDINALAESIDKLHEALTATSTDASDKLTFKEFLSSNMMLGDEKAEEIIMSTDTSTKESEG